MKEKTTKKNEPKMPEALKVIFEFIVVIAFVFGAAIAIQWLAIVFSIVIMIAVLCFIGEEWKKNENEKEDEDEDGDSEDEDYYDGMDAE